MDGASNPVDLVIDHGGLLYVLNRAGSDVAERMVSKRISICTVEEDYIGEFGMGGVADGEMMWPCAIVMSDDGYLFVSDEALNRISIFDKDGGFVDGWGVQGTRAGQFNRPAGIAFDAEGNLLVADGLNNRVQRFTPEGRYLDGWGKAGSGSGEFNVPWGITTSADGNIFVADWRNDRVQKFDADGKHLAMFGAPGGSDGKLHRPSGVSLDEDGNLHIADWGNHRVQVLDPEGRFLAGFRGNAGMSRWSEDYFRANPDELEERQKADLEPIPRPAHHIRRARRVCQHRKILLGPPHRSGWITTAGCMLWIAAAIASRCISERQRRLTKDAELPPMPALYTTGHRDGNDTPVRSSTSSPICCTFWISAHSSTNTAL